jgi:hypothetical protein
MWASRGADDDSSSSGGASAGGGSAAGGGGGADGAPATFPVAVNLREACARELGALMRALLLPMLTARCAPPALRADALEALASWTAVPQLLMEL